VLKRVIQGIVRSHEQTGEDARDPVLKTRYYKLSKEKVWDEIMYILKQMNGYKVVYEVKNVGEIIVEKRTFTGRIQDITITVIAINPVKTAIDIYSASRGSLGDLGSNYRSIVEILQEFDQALSEYKE